MIEYFKSLNNSNKYAAEQLLCNKYSPETLGPRFVAFNDEKCEYWVFDDAQAFLKYLGEKGPGPFHEVIFGWRAQKLKFDLDINSSVMDGDEAAKIIRSFMVALEIAFDQYFGQGLLPENVLITTSHAPGQKYSFHVIIVGYHVVSHKVADQFTKFLIEQVEPEIRPFIDSVNKSVQNFRAPGCYKARDPARIKTIVTEHQAIDAIICDLGKNSKQIGPLEVPQEDSGIEIGHLDLTDPIIKTALQKAAPWTEGCEPNSLSRGQGFTIIYFKRKVASGCKFCGPTAFHENENSPIVKISGSVWVRCRRAPHSTPWKFVWSLKNHYEQGGVVADCARAAPPESGKFAQELLARYSAKIAQKTVYSTREMAPIDLGGANILIRAGMKMGKTNAIVAAIEKWMFGRGEEGLVGARIIIVSFRQTFSAAIFEKFKRFGFVLYSDIKGPIVSDKVIVQIESIARLDISGNNRKPDLVILDESEAIFEQFDSGLIRNFPKTWSTFCWLMKWSDKVICSDAYLGDRTIKVLWALRPKLMSAHFNNHEIASPDNYNIYSHKFKWMKELQAALEAGQNIAMPFSSLKAAETVHQWIQQKYPGKRIGFYSSKTSASIKRAHFSNVNKFWAQYNVLIYTPTISAGVSFETAHYDSVFAYFTNMSCTTETCMQMVGRIRNVKSGQFHIFIEQMPEILPTTYKGIKEDVFNARQSLWAADNGPLPEYYLDEEGQPTFHKTPHLALWLENKMSSNLSRTYFTARFVELLAQYGAKYAYISPNPGELDDLENLGEEYKSIKDGLADENHKSISDAADIDQAEFQQIRESMSSQNVDISPQQRACYEKYKLRNAYEWQNPVTPEFVEKYNIRANKQLFRNIRAIFGPSYDVAQYPGNNTRLAEIRAREQNYCKYQLSQGDVGEQRDLNYQYTFAIHRALLTIISILGWLSPFDTSYRARTTIYDNIRAQSDNIVALILSMPFEARKGDPPQGLFIFDNWLGQEAKHIFDMLNYFNILLFANYGLRIQPDRTDRSMYKIKQIHSIWKDIIDPLRLSARMQQAAQPPAAEAPMPAPININDVVNGM